MVQFNQWVSLVPTHDFLFNYKTKHSQTSYQLSVLPIEEQLIHFLKHSASRDEYWNFSTIALYATVNTFPEALHQKR